MGKGKAKQLKAAAAPPLKAQGTGKKRTPQSAFDSAAGKDVYEPEKVIAQRTAKGGVTQYQIKWVGWESKHNTWEPLENLAGCEDMIADFKEREKQRHAELDAEAEAKRIQKQEAFAKQAAENAVAAAADRVAALASGTPVANVCTPVDESTVSVQTPGSRRTAPIWEAFDHTGCPAGHAACKLLLVTGEVCGKLISTKAGPAGLWNHAMYHHKPDYMRLKPPTETLDFTVDPQAKLAALAPKLRDAIHKAIARWLVKRKRPLSLPEDPEFHDIFKIAMQGSYAPPDHKIVLSNVLLLAGEGKKKLYDVNTSLRANGMKPAMAGDIWSDRGVSLFGMCEYYISDEWEILELVLAAKSFSERHTAENIEKVTSEACVEAGLSADVKSTVFLPISDNAANMIAGWSKFGRGPCCVHTGQLSVHIFLEHPRIKPTRTKERGITTHFSFRTGVDGLGALHKCQRETNSPETHPVKDNDTRWSSGHDQMEWFRVGQRAVQSYDINHARKAGDAYKDHQMGLEDWRINLEGVAVLQPIADWTQHMQGTKYPTLPLVLPTVYSLIGNMAPEAHLTLAFPGEEEFELEPDEMHPGVLEARTAMHKDWVCRWITDLDPEVKRIYAMAALLHPCFKSYNFIDDFELILPTDKDWALQELRSEWATVWKPRPLAAKATANAPPVAPTAYGMPLTKKRKVTLGGLLVRVKKETETVTDRDACTLGAPARIEFDELEAYLSDPEEVSLDIKVLEWWRVKEVKWPNLAKMVKQYFAAPASSAGVERVFSAAGKMHGDLSKSAKDDTLEASLIAAFNTD